MAGVTQGMTNLKCSNLTGEVAVKPMDSREVHWLGQTRADLEIDAKQATGHFPECRQSETNGVCAVKVQAAQEAFRVPWTAQEPWFPYQERCRKVITWQRL